MKKFDLITKESFNEESCQIFGFIIKSSHYFDALVSKGLKQYGISKTQFDVLVKIYFIESDEAVTLSELGKLLMVSKANITGITTRLEERGFIERVVNKNDARSKEVKLTKSGTKMVETVVPKYLRRVHELINNYGAKDKKVLYKTLQNFHDSLLKQYEEEN